MMYRRKYRKSILGGSNTALSVKKIYIGDSNNLAREVYSAAPPIHLKTFSEATEEELLAMVTAADNGLIDLYDDAGWRIGQERTVNISVIASSGTYDGISWNVGETQPAQSITLVLMHKGLYQLVTPVKAKGGATRNTCSFIIGVKDCLLTKGRINTGANADWSVTNRKDWCNSGFRQSLPENIRNCFKKFKCTTGTITSVAPQTTGGPNIVTEDYFSLAAIKEIEGSSMSRSTDNEANALTQFTWYTTAANRKKNINGAVDTYWTRSPWYNYSSKRFCRITNTGTVETTAAPGNMGISPFGVI